MVDAGAGVNNGLAVLGRRMLARHDGPRRRLLRVLLAMSLGCALPALDLPGSPAALELWRGMQLEAPSPRYDDQSGVASFTNGFVLRIEDRVVTGRALLWDRAPGQNCFFASGSVVLVAPGLRVEAERLGLRRLPPEQADQLPEGRLPYVIEAWGVQVDLDQPDPEDDKRNRAALRDARNAHEAQRIAAIQAAEASASAAALSQARALPAFDARAWSQQHPVRTLRTRRLAAGHLLVRPDRIELRQVHLDGGHGGVLSMDTPRLLVRLREEPLPDVAASASTPCPAHHPDLPRWRREVADVTVHQPTVRLSGVPVLWLPLLYRDFRHDYPWTRYEFGYEERLGYYGRGWIGSEVDDPFHVHPTLRLRGDTYSRAGEGFGAQSLWNLGLLGKGDWTWYGMPNEQVYLSKGPEQAWLMGPPTPGRAIGAEMFASGGERAPIITRSAHAMDFEHHVGWKGLTLAARWVDIPDADPIPPDVLNPAMLFATPEVVQPNERFRADYLREELESRPNARRGVAAAHSNAWLTTVVDTERKHHEDLDETDRLLGTQFALNNLHLAGPLHVRGDAWYEWLRRDAPEKRWIDRTTLAPGITADGIWREQEAHRLNWDTGLAAMEWLGPLGWDAAAGLRGLGYAHLEQEQWRRRPLAAYPFGLFDRYYDPARAVLLAQQDLGSQRLDERSSTDADYGAFTPSQARFVPYASSGLRLRAESDWTPELRHVFTPRIGIEALGHLRGPDDDDWQPVDFGDGRDSLDEDDLLGVTGFTTTLSRRTRLLASLDLDLRWALRPADRVYVPRLEPEEQAVVSLASSRTKASVSTAIAQSLAGLPYPLTPQANLVSNEILTDAYAEPLQRELQAAMTEEVGNGSLTRIDLRTVLKPIESLSFSGDAGYDALRDTFDSLAFKGQWQMHRAIALRYRALWLPAEGEVDERLVVLRELLRAEDADINFSTTQMEPRAWEQGVGVLLTTDRYRLDSEVIFRPEGKTVDGWRTRIVRRLVDGEVSLRFDLLRDEDGLLTEQRWSFDVSLFGFDIYDQPRE
jgi:hypothetical protein